MLSIGEQAPNFIAESTQGTIQLSQYAGKNVVLIFYPKNNTSL